MSLEKKQLVRWFNVCCSLLVVRQSLLYTFEFLYNSIQLTNSTHEYSFFCFYLIQFSKLKFFSIDTVLDQAVHKEISLGSNFNKPSLQSRLLKARSPKDKRIHVMKFADLLSKCLVLDPSKRISVKSALKHDFFTTPSS